jgi:hypothetical protein
MNTDLIQDRQETKLMPKHKKKPYIKYINHRPIKKFKIFNL